jgi:hypothetical protein
MKERPILFKGEMLRAVLEGRKTQERIIIKPQYACKTVSWGCIGGQGFGFIFTGHDTVVKAPWNVGDRLWVRETVNGIFDCDSFYEITGVRVERLNDISEADAASEGVTLPEPELETYYSGFRRLWQSINGSDSWAANPWVWVITFQKVSQ